jgi:hypothetical protein
MPINVKKLSYPDALSSLIAKSLKGSPGPASLGLVIFLVK